MYIPLVAQKTAFGKPKNGYEWFAPGEVGFVLCVVRPRPCGVSKSILASARGVSAGKL
jgi:hypothetical protein